MRGPTEQQQGADRERGQTEEADIGQRRERVGVGSGDAVEDPDDLPAAPQERADRKHCTRPPVPVLLGRSRRTTTRCDQGRDPNGDGADRLGGCGLRRVRQKGTDQDHEHDAAGSSPQRRSRNPCAGGLAGVGSDERGHACANQPPTHTTVPHRSDGSVSLTGQARHFRPAVRRMGSVMPQACAVMRVPGQVHALRHEGARRWVPLTPRSGPGFTRARVRARRSGHVLPKRPPGCARWSRRAQRTRRGTARRRWLRPAG